MFKKINQQDFIKKLKLELNPSVLKSSFALLFLIVLLIFSWLYLSDPNKMNRKTEQQHALLKSRFKEVLSELIEKKHPEVNNISFHKLWTKQTKDLSKVEIYFNYSLNSEDGENHLEGSALLSLSENEVWQIKDFQVQKIRLDFSEPILIKANPKN